MPPPFAHPFKPLHPRAQVIEFAARGIGDGRSQTRRQDLAFNDFVVQQTKRTHPTVACSLMHPRQRRLPALASLRDPGIVLTPIGCSRVKRQPRLRDAGKPRACGLRCKVQLDLVTQRENDSIYVKNKALAHLLGESVRRGNRLL